VSVTVAVVGAAAATGLASAAVKPLKPPRASIASFERTRMKPKTILDAMSSARYVCACWSGLILSAPSDAAQTMG
jgi:hypothetical protein